MRRVKIRILPWFLCKSRAIQHCKVKAKINVKLNSAIKTAKFRNFEKTPQHQYAMKNKKTLVLGATPKSDRYAHRAITSLVNQGHPVVAVGQLEGEVAGVKIQTKAIPLKNIDTVTLYLNPANQRQYYNYIIEARPQRVIFNPGTENPELYQLLKSNNITIEVGCTLVMLATGQY